MVDIYFFQHVWVDMHIWRYSNSLKVTIQQLYQFPQIHDENYEENEWLFNNQNEYSLYSSFYDSILKSQKQR